MLKNGEAPKKMAVRVKNIAIAAALIVRVLWSFTIFLDTTIRPVAVGSGDFCGPESARGCNAGARRWKILRPLIVPN